MNATISAPNTIALKMRAVTKVAVEADMEPDSSVLVDLERMVVVS